ncbi:cytochrome P450 [Neolentinus lepideus HHB14362 ss-1]|uniref:Cytochrome P450 n=1 Tax=Neolentinus lepideus HHB14362 ss-1 TaxID=1314782 RepID=A0A165TJP5_9AGAM|nr:cytochrome P450 [Neolentinus lepideus HHB14362 ss-1]
MLLLDLLLCATVVALLFALYYVFIAPRFSPLRELPGPPVQGIFGNHMGALLNPDKSPGNHEKIVKHYGRLVRIRGIGPWDERVLPLDPLSISHVLKNSTIYEKPWQSRQLITGLIGCGILAAEGQVHKRQRRVATPAFSIQNMRALIPLVFSKGHELKEKWNTIISEDHGGLAKEKGIVLDVCSWVSRATFDVIGSAGFDYEFNAIQDESNELFLAYKEMFEIAISQSAGGALRSVLAIYFPIINKLFPNEATRTVDKAHEVIERVAGQLIQEKKRTIEEGELNGKGYHGKDLLTLLLKSNVATDLPPEQRISDEDILHNINTFMFAGSDTTSLALTWTLALLAQHPQMQTRLRAELLSIAPSSDLTKLTPDETESFYTAISNLSYLHNVVRESLRLIPPVHSSLRVATQDDVIPVSSPFCMRGQEERSGFRIPKGTFVHVPIEAFQLDKEWWGEDAWSFNPDRWDNLPDIVTELPGLFSNLLTFSAGPRSCIGMRFSMIEMKTFLYILLTNFVFSSAGSKIIRANVVLTRPYVQGRYKEGSQCPLLVRPYRGEEL